MCHCNKPLWNHNNYRHLSHPFEEKTSQKSSSSIWHKHKFSADSPYSSARTFFKQWNLLFDREQCICELLLPTKHSRWATKLARALFGVLSYLKEVNRCLNSHSERQTQNTPAVAASEEAHSVSQGSMTRRDTRQHAYILHQQTEWWMIFYRWSV